MSLKDFIIYFFVLQPQREFAALGSTLNRVLYLLVIVLRLLLFFVPLCISFGWISVGAFLVGAFFPLFESENVHPRTTNLVYLCVSTLALLLGVIYHHYELAMCLYSVVTLRYDLVLSYHSFRKKLGTKKN